MSKLSDNPDANVPLGPVSKRKDRMMAEETAVQPEQGEAPQAPEVKRLEEEGEVAADYLEELLDIADLGGDIDIDVEHGRAAVAIVTEEGEPTDGLEALVGDGGDVLDALQELTRLAVQTKTGERSRLMLDITGFRAQRKAELIRVAQRVVDEVSERGVCVSLDPMNAFERKVVHDAVASAGLISESSGVEPERFVVIRPA